MVLEIYLKFQRAKGTGTLWFIKGRRIERLGCIAVRLIRETPDNMIKRMLKRGLFGIACVFSLFIYCTCDEDDEHHNHDANEQYSSLRQDEQHKGDEVLLSSENLPALAFIRDCNDAL